LDTFVSTVTKIQALRPSRYHSVLAGVRSLSFVQTAFGAQETNYWTFNRPLFFRT